jgi:hypothetical protein
MATVSNKRILAFGDSFTQGTDLSDHSEHKASRLVWPGLLADHFNWRFANQGLGGASNATIVRHFFHVWEYASVDKDRCYNPETDLFIFNWTWINRWEMFNKETNNWEIVRPTGSTNNDFHKIYYKHIHSEVWDKYESLKNILIVLTLLETKGFKYIATCIDPLIINSTHHYPDFIRPLLEEVKQRLTWFDGKGFYDWSKDKGFPISDTWHPLEEAHQAAFKYILNNHDFT